MCDQASSVVAEAELSAAPPGRTARLVLDLGGQRKSYLGPPETRIVE